MKRSLTTIPALLCGFLLAIPQVALAGDPCPIDFEFHDAGAPDWLDHGKLLEALKSKDSWVGISFRSGKAGVGVTRVYAGSPAAKAGLLVKDLITAADGVKVTDHKALAAIFKKAAAGASVTIALTRAGKPVSVKLTLGAQDPVVGALIDHVSAQECTDVGRADLTAAQKKAIRGAVFSKQRRFLCKDAHKKLKDFDYGGGVLTDGHIVVVRGSKRVLISNPGWSTVCVAASSLDGAKLTPAALGAVYRRFSSKYVADRRANP